MDVDLHTDWERQLERNPGVARAVLRAAEVVVEDAQERAPRGPPPDPGAESIHHEQVEEVPPTYRVSWDPEHFYMKFNELGTEHQRARPFLRPAADAPAHRNE